MDKTLETLRKTYRLPAESTPENLELRWSRIITFDEFTIIAGYSYRRDGNCHFSAVYKFITDDHTCEGRVKLVAVSDRQFYDDGHALAWGMNETYHC
ncbi:MAG: hypothetical protein IJ766_05015 [Clostridia bacterium]|nr:hypothetical protein [Clostridia bacterium]